MREAAQYILDRFDGNGDAAGLGRTAMAPTVGVMAEPRTLADPEE